jgi:hypothetical protein
MVAIVTSAVTPDGIGPPVAGFCGGPPVACAWTGTTATAIEVIKRAIMIKAKDFAFIVFIGFFIFFSFPFILLERKA